MEHNFETTDFEAKTAINHNLKLNNIEAGAGEGYSTPQIFTQSNNITFRVGSPLAVLSA